MKLSPTEQHCRGLLRIKVTYCSDAPHAEGLSPAPHAEPHAEGLSCGLPPAPQAELQAVGFSCGLSPAPHAEPQEAAFSFQPAKFESAIIYYLHFVFGTFPAPCLHCTEEWHRKKVRTNLLLSYFFVTLLQQDTIYIII